MVKRNKVWISFFFGIGIVVIVLFISSYAIITDISKKNVWTHILRIDEDAYGDTSFDSSDIDLKPILDSKIETNLENVIGIHFNVGGSELNDEKNIVYDIALVDLKVDCDLLSPYLKWKLVKNDDEIFSGSFDYHFDTINQGRIVLTTIQQDLVDYSENKSDYDHYSFYIWLSDSCQEESISNCIGEFEDQSNLINKHFSGKIEVELYAKNKEALVRKPSENIITNTCIKKDSGSDD